MDYITITGLEVFAHHGVYPEETANGQNFYVNAKLYVDMNKAGCTDQLTDSVNYGEVCEFISDFLKENTYKLLEKAVTETIKALLIQFPLLSGIEMELCKPKAPIALPFENVSVTRRLDWHTAYISFGSNMGDRKAYIDGALQKIRLDTDFRNMEASQIIVTKPYGGVEQEDFLNGVVKVQTYLTPEELLDRLHEMEQAADRKREIHWGPRTLDLDILFYDHETVDTEKLTIPHIDMQNRQFVLEPMCELAGYFRHPVLNRTMNQLLAELEFNSK